MTNLNIELPDEIHKKLKFEALNEDKTLKSLIIEKLTYAVEGRKKDAKRK
jgi:predicted HicB family RNase H-like nuclease